jgi:uncharacterized damage-inducible protein DinB
MSGNQPVDTSVRTGTLVSLFRHNTWANLKLLDFCAGLSGEQLRATATGAYGSLRMTLSHMIGAEVDYVGRATGKTPGKPFPTDRHLGFDELKEMVRWTGEELSQLALTAPADTIVREELPEEGVAVEYPLAGLLVQAVNHATEHRQQVSAIITQLGMEPPVMDAWTWMEETGTFREYRTGPGSATPGGTE